MFDITGGIAKGINRQTADVAGGIFTKEFTVPQFADGGLVPRPSDKKGGLIKGPGTGTSDSIPASLPVNSVIIPADVVKQYGADFFDKFNEAADIESKGEDAAENGEEVPAKVSNGEVMITREAVKMFGADFFDKIIASAHSDTENPKEDAVPGEEMAEMPMADNEQGEANMPPPVSGQLGVNKSPMPAMDMMSPPLGAAKQPPMTSLAPQLGDKKPKGYASGGLVDEQQNNGLGAGGGIRGLSQSVTGYAQGGEVGKTKMVNGVLHAAGGAFVNGKWIEDNTNDLSLKPNQNPLTKPVSGPTQENADQLAQTQRLGLNRLAGKDLNYIQPDNQGSLLGQGVKSVANTLIGPKGIADVNNAADSVKQDAKAGINAAVQGANQFVDKTKQSAANIGTAYNQGVDQGYGALGGVSNIGSKFISPALGDEQPRSVAPSLVSKPNFVTQPIADNKPVQAAQQGAKIYSPEERAQYKNVDWNTYDRSQSANTKGVQAEADNAKWYAPENVAARNKVNDNLTAQNAQQFPEPQAQEGLGVSRQPVMSGNDYINQRAQLIDQERRAQINGMLDQKQINGSVIGVPNYAQTPDDSDRNLAPKLAYDYAALGQAKNIANKGNDVERYKVDTAAKTAQAALEAPEYGVVPGQEEQANPTLYQKKGKRPNAPEVDNSPEGQYVSELKNLKALLQNNGITPDQYKEATQKMHETYTNSHNQG